MFVLLFVAEKSFLLDIIITRRTLVLAIERVFYEPNKFSIHAENDAIKKIKNKNILKECKIFIGKIINGELEQALPCQMCCDLLKKYGVSKICCI